MLYLNVIFGCWNCIVWLCMMLFYISRLCFFEVNRQLLCFGVCLLVIIECMFGMILLFGLNCLSLFVVVYGVIELCVILKNGCMLVGLEVVIVLFNQKLVFGVVIYICVFGKVGWFCGVNRLYVWFGCRCVNSMVLICLGWQLDVWMLLVRLFIVGLKYVFDFVLIRMCLVLVLIRKLFIVVCIFGVFDMNICVSRFCIDFVFRLSKVLVGRLVQLLQSVVIMLLFIVMW